MTSKDDLYHDFLLIMKMKVSEKIKIRILTQLFGETENPWRVIGVTKRALEIFKNNNFNRVSGMGINRAHINDRKTTYTTMLITTFENADEWWDFYYENDETILSTSSENKSSSFSEVIDFDNAGYLFKSSGYAWSHRKKIEAPFLQKLAEEYL